MAQPYVGEIRMFAGNFAPAGWMLCQGQLLPISENEVLFQLIGTTYGGDGESTFALPDLAGRIPVHQGTGGGGTYTPGQAAGVETVTITTQQMPAHTHALIASQHIADQSSPANAVPAQSALANLYIEDTPTIGTSPSSVTAVGGSQPHENMAPYLCINYIISLFGIFPSQT
jgi:microcystin-dependent protein